MESVKNKDLKKTAEKLDLLLIMRGLLAVSVIIWHVEGYKGEIFSIANIPGRTAVWIFFGISGYVMAYGFIHGKYQYTTTDLKRFYLNRIARIFPLFFLISLVSLITVVGQTGINPINGDNFLQQFFMLQFNHSYMLSGVFWTLGIEVQFYIIAPFLAYIFLSKIRYIELTVIGIYLIFIAWVPLSYLLFGWSLDGRNLTTNLSHFFIGMLLCFIVSRNRFRVNSYILSALFILILFISNYLYHHYLSYYWVFGPVIIDILIAILILLHSQLSGEIIRDRGKLLSFLTLLGTVSYGIYAWHPYFVAHTVSLSITAIVVISITIAYLSFRILEKPIVNFNKSQNTKRII